MFKSLLSSIADKISNLNPIRHFIKYALDKTLNEFLAKELTLDDFKNGPLNLNNIQINCQKINQEHLISSPYILHYGIIGHLKISLPPLTEISTKSIEISIENVQVSLKPNKKFAENFKEKMFELNELKKFHVQEKLMEGEISQNGPVDFFKQLLKNIIMNIKIDVKNIAIRLYMNTPSNDSSQPQYFTLLRIPCIQLKKKEEKELKKNEAEELKFYLVIPQISLHLLREDINYPDYGNLPYQKGDFPFVYPPVSHPSTILLIGSSEFSARQYSSQDSLQKKTSFSFCLITDYTIKTKELTLSLDVQNFQIMITPVQLKILSRFVIQMMEFKKILEKIIEEIKLQTGENLSLVKKKSFESQHGNNDFFSSLMMSINTDLGPQGLTRSRSSNNQDLFQSIINQNSTIKKDVRIFNEKCAEEVRKTLKYSQQISLATSLQEFQAINFKNIVNFHAQLTKLTIYILKHSPVFDFKRIWSDNHLATSSFNQSIGCAHFLLVIEKAQMNQKVNEKIIDANFKSMKMFNVKLKQTVESTIDDYYDIKDSVEFYSMSVHAEDVSAFIRTEPDLLQYHSKPTSHYCREEILKINQNEENPNNQIKTYCLIPKFEHNQSDAYILYKPGFSIHFDKKQNYIKLNVETITVSATMEILEDVLNIVYPIFMYRRISDLISFKREQLNIQKSQKKSLFESQYECRIDMMKYEEFQETNSKKDIIVLDISELKVGFRTGKSVQGFEHLTKKNKEKLYDQDCLNKQCFCNINDSSCLYAEVTGIQLKKKSMLKFSCKKIEAGLFQIKNSEIKTVSSILRLDSHRQEDGLRIFKQNLNCLLLSVVVPGVNIRITENMLQPLFKMAKQNLMIVNHLMAYKYYLQNQMAMIEQYSTQIQRKTKKNENKQVQIKLFIDQVFVDLDFCLLKAEKIYFTKFTDGLVAKLSSFIVGLKRDVKVKNCQFRNQLMLISEYPKSMRHYMIPDSDVILEIFDPSQGNLAFKSMEKEAFFEKIVKQRFSISFNFFKKQTERCQQRMEQTGFKKNQNATFSQKFKFKQVNSTIEEEGEKFILNFDIHKNIHVYLCNAMQLLALKEKIFKTIDLVKKQKDDLMEIKSKTMLMERKNSSEIQSQSIEINLKCKEVHVDIRPDFVKKQNQKFFGPTRLIACLKIGDTSLFINKEKNTKNVTTSFDLVVYFLKVDDRQISLNPLLLKEDNFDYSTLGFKAIFQVARAALIFKNYGIRNIVSFKIGNILGQASLKTLGYLQLHLEHFINHHVKREMGVSLEELYDNEEYCNLNEQQFEMEEEQNLDKIIVFEDDDELIIEDLTEAEIEYEKKLTMRINDQKQLKQRVFHHTSIPNSVIFIQSLTIEKMTVRLNCADDFNFIRLIQVQSSTSQKRCRQKQPEQNRYLTLNMNGLHLACDVDSSLQLSNPERNKKLDIFKSYISIEKLKLTMSKQKFVGHNSLRLIQDQIQHQGFTLFGNENQICLISQINPQRILVKSYSVKIKVGATSQIITLLKFWKQCNKDIEKEGWKKIYDKEKKDAQDKPKESDRKILILLPQSIIKLSLHYEGVMSILDEQKIVTTELLINEELSSEYVIKKKLRKWVQKLVKDNLGSLLSRTAVNLLFSLISQIIALNVAFIGKFLSLFFGNSE